MPAALLEVGNLLLLPHDSVSCQVTSQLAEDGFPENRDVCQLFLMKGCRPWPQTTASVTLLKTLYLLSQLKMLCVIYTCDNFVSKAFLYNKGSILRSAASGVFVFVVKVSEG